MYTYLFSLYESFNICVYKLYDSDEMFTAYGQWWPFGAMERLDDCVGNPRPPQRQSRERSPRHSNPLFIIWQCDVCYVANAAVYSTINKTGGNPKKSFILSFISHQL